MADWKAVWKSAVAAAMRKVKSRTKKTEEYAKHAFEAHKTSLQSLLAAYSAGKIDKATFEGELADEKRILLAELRESSVGTKCGRDAATAFFSVLEQASAGSW